MPLADGYAVEKFLEGLSFTIAEAITGYIKDEIPEGSPVEKEMLGFCLFLVDRTTGSVKYISSIKDNVAVVEMLRRVLGERSTRELVSSMKEQAKPENVTPGENVTPIEEDKDKPPTIN